MFPFGNVSIDIALLANAHLLSMARIYHIQHQEKELNARGHQRCVLTVI